MNPKEAEFSLKQEGQSNDHEKEKASSSSSSLASQWPRLKDPRIVRVSRAFGGKDRHSKVCTIRGLRDRRVRLSVPTAIQLYDLQDRLGLNQPSKVVDWLLNVAKDEIDELPPLPNFPPLGNFNFGFPSFDANTNSISHPNNQFLNMNINRNNIHWEGSTSSQNSMLKLKAKEVSSEMVIDDKANYWMNRTTQEEENNNKQGSNEGVTPSAHVLTNNNNLLQQRANHASFLGLLNTIPLGNNYNWGASNDVNSSQLGNHGFITNQDVNVVTSLPPMLSLSTGNSQMLSYFPSQVATMEMDHHQRQMSNHYHQMLSSSSQNPLTNSLNPSFSLDMMTNAKLLQNSRENSSNKEQDFSPK